MASPEPLDLPPEQWGRLLQAVFGPPRLIRLPRRPGRLWRRRVI
jgi:hypothetical protein